MYNTINTNHLQEDIIDESLSESEELPRSTRCRLRKSIVVSDDDYEELQNDSGEDYEEVSSTKKRLKVKKEKDD